MCWSIKFFLERVLFPTDILTFMAPNDSRVEIWEMNYMDLNWKREQEFLLIMKIHISGLNGNPLIVFESKFFTNTYFLLILSS